MIILISVRRLPCGQHLLVAAQIGKDMGEGKLSAFLLLGLSRVSLCHASVAAAAGDDGGGGDATAAAMLIMLLVVMGMLLLLVVPSLILEPTDDGDDDGPFTDTKVSFSRLPADDQKLFRDSLGL